MNAEIELHDSTVQQITEVSGSVSIDLSAYIHKSEGRPGIDRGTGWVQEARLTFVNATVVGARPDLPQDIWDGEMLIEGRKHENSIPIPLEGKGECQLRLVFISGEELVVSASSAVLELLGEESYVEEFYP